MSDERFVWTRIAGRVSTVIDDEETGASMTIFLYEVDALIRLPVSRERCPRPGQFVAVEVLDNPAVTHGVVTERRPGRG